MTTVDSTGVRTYGGWRRSRGLGLFGLGAGPTALLLVGVMVLVVAGTTSLRAFVVLAVPLGVVLALSLARWDGLSLGRRLIVRLRWWWATLRGYTSYRSGVLVATDHAWSLPGVLAATRLVSVPDRPTAYGLVHHQRRNTYTATLVCAATSTWLADKAEGDAWVAGWGAWLASLGHHSAIDHVAVTVDSASDPGSRLADHVSRRILPSAPASAVRILRQLVDAAPATAADVQTRVSITFRAPTGVGPEGGEDPIDLVSRLLPGLQDSLAGCGLTVLRRASAAELIGIVRTAFDPAVRGDIDRMLHLPGGVELSQWLDWDTAGPMMAEEHFDCYQHDTGWSVTWAWHEAPRQQVHADVLARLVAPGPYPKRVTLLYRPLSAAEAAHVVEREVNAAAFRAALSRVQRRDESARDATDRHRAQRAALEEATGAGIGYLSLFVTVTVTDRDHLGRAVADIEARADMAKIRLRKLLAGQAAGFAITLPCGIFPPALARTWPR